MPRLAPVVLLLALWGVPAFADESATRLAVFPTLEGRTLGDDTVELPADFAVELNLVFLTFARKHQDDVNTWIQTADALQRALPEFRHYQVAPFGDAPKPLHKIILGAMRKTYPTPELQARYILLEMGSDTFAEIIELTDDSQTLQLLLDGDGRVLWSTRGAATAETLESLRAVTSSAAAAPP